MAPYFAAGRRLLLSSTGARRISPLLARTKAGVQFFGTNCSGGNGKQNKTTNDPHAMFKEQMEELKAEREDLFGFTEEDQMAWANAKDHKHHHSFLNEVNAARDAAHTTVDEIDEDDNDEDYRSNPMEDHDTVPYSLHKLSSRATHNPIADDHVASASYKGPNSTLSHISHNGTSVHMVDVGQKQVTDRIAVAEARVVFPDAAWKALTAASKAPSTPQSELVGPKGPILTTAKIAGIQAAKKTSDLIPLCHPLPINSVNVGIALDSSAQTALIRCECKVTHKTGVEMEALTGATVAALTIYDMCKAVSHDIQIEGTRLVKKEGGKRTVNKL